MLCFVVVMQSFIMNSHEIFIHIHQGCFAGTGAIVRLPQCQWSKPDGYGKISQCITTAKHSNAKTVCIFLGIYCILASLRLGSTKSQPSIQYCIAPVVAFQCGAVSTKCFQCCSSAPCNIRWVALWYSSVHLVNQWHSGVIPLDQDMGYNINFKYY